MELLLELYLKVQQVSPLPVFTKETIIVQNAGMQHWLNMSLANLRGISMNYGYALPSQFLWKLAKTIAGDDESAEQLSYSREVLAWRIYQLFDDVELKNDVDFSDVYRYWQSETNDKTASLKRYQFAVQLADLFEQYLVFRPDWLNAWQQVTVNNLNSLAKGFNEELNEEVKKTIRWQAKLWAKLQQQIPYNPTTLIEKAQTNLEKNKALLPPRISFFGINAMAPMWLSFIEKVSEYTQVHFFHLNPCADYWGDVQTEKQAFKYIENWLTADDELTHLIGNPLLANLGQQGREFLSLLQQISTYAIDAFEEVEHLPLNTEKPNILQQIQQDILCLQDNRLKPQAVNNQQTDQSITITSAHSALREVQGLHDWLLAQLNNDKSLTPKDILVMCPQVENYAPYVDAVFTRGWQDLDSKVPPLPCSIADRVTKNSDAVVATFLELLALPDSRFQVNKLLAFLRVNAVQEKFNFTQPDIDKITLWLQQAAIHWGIDENHKAQIISDEQLASTTQYFTWKQGLSRLMRGFAYADQETIFQQQLLLPNVEGDDVQLLGQLMLLIEQLQWHSQQLNKKRTASQWQTYLTELFESCFKDNDGDSSALIYQAINQLVEYCQAANFEQTIDLLLVKDFLSQHFSEPDPGRQFMVGQVTFCSMLPMRSIPFKIIAILGLNDGEYPRQRNPVTFDLMEKTSSRVGDRSRRGDDRYLFLEAIISARQALYLSYQGNNIKNNAQQQPSLVLKELFDYLSSAYGWEFDPAKTNNIRQLPMQAFSHKNYQGDLPSFDGKWQKLLSRQSSTQALIIASPFKDNSALDNNCLANDALNESVTPIKLSLNELIKFYQHPAKYFAEQQLNLPLTQRQVLIDDVEPFKSEQLVSYLYRQDLLAIELDEQLTVENKQQAKQLLTQHYELAGKIPDLPTSEGLLSEWQHTVDEFSKVITTLNLRVTQLKNMVLSVNLMSGEKVELSFELPLAQSLSAEQQPVAKASFYRSSRAKAKDLITLAFTQLCLQVAKTSNSVGEYINDDVSYVNTTYGCYFDTKTQQVSSYQVLPFEQPLELLTQLIATFMQGNQQALLLNADIAEKHCKKPLTQIAFEKLWHDPNAVSLGDDVYMQYFWPQVPNFSQHEPLINQTYQTLFAGIKKVKLS